ncbi:MAG: helix-turn-helix transcriptional regulator [Litorimonas sp.]
MDALIPNWRTVMMAMVVGVLLICGVALLLRRVEARAARPLGAFLILAGLSMGPQVIGYAGAYQIWPWLTFLPLFFTDLWLAPLLVVHAHRLTRGTELGWRRWLFAPAVIQSLYYAGAFLLPGDGLFDTPAKWAFNDAVHEPYWLPLERTVGIGLLVFALYYLLRERRAYLAFLESAHSAVPDYDPNWLRNIALAVLAAGLIYAGLQIAEIVAEPSYDAAFPFQVGLMAVLAWLGLDAAWRLTERFPKIAARTALASGPDDLGERIAARLRAEEWYLEPRLSIRDVARRMATNESYVSRALNRAGGQSFNRTVNALRVEHAKTLLAQGDAPVLNVAMESGFNSKATFNRVFRELTGETPSRYRQSRQTARGAEASQKP